MNSENFRDYNIGLLEGWLDATNAPEKYGAALRRVVGMAKRGEVLIGSVSKEEKQINERREALVSREEIDVLFERDVKPRLEPEAEKPRMVIKPISTPDEQDLLRQQEVEELMKKAQANRRPDPYKTADSQFDRITKPEPMAPPKNFTKFVPPVKIEKKADDGDRKRTPWTEEQTQFLRDNIATMSLAQIGKRCGEREYVHVYQKAKALGLR